jgi:arsenate reductase
MMKKVLFLCSGNTCRSQMAEGWMRHLAGDVLEPHSAGTRPGALDPRAVQVMAEAGVDISGQESTSVNGLDTEDFDCVVTVCSRVMEACPMLHGANRFIYRGFDDPPRLAADVSDEEEALELYRRIRDEIRDFVEELVQELTSEQECSTL